LVRFKLEGETEHSGGWLVTGVTLQPKVTVPVKLCSAVTVNVQVVVADWACGVTDCAEELATRVKLPPVASPVTAAESSFATSTDPNPVAWSYPVPTLYPARPPLRLDTPGVLLLHMEGSALVHPLTPELAGVTSWKTSWLEAASP
jgi:hypothetical protein